MSLQDAIKKMNDMNAIVAFYGGEKEEIFVYLENGGKKSFLTFDDFIFWVEDTYKGRNGKTLPCYKISKKGCEFIQHKMTWQKGAIFT